MPYCELPPNPSYVLQIEKTPIAHGTEGILVNKNQIDVLLHWDAQTETQREDDSISLDDLEYTPIPSKRSFKVKVRYVYGGKGTPPDFDYGLD